MFITTTKKRKNQSHFGKHNQIPLIALAGSQSNIYRGRDHLICADRNLSMLRFRVSPLMGIAGPDPLGAFKSQTAIMTPRHREQVDRHYQVVEFLPPLGLPVQAKSTATPHWVFRRLFHLVSVMISSLSLSDQSGESTCGCCYNQPGNRISATNTTQLKKLHPSTHPACGSLHRHVARL